VLVTTLIICTDFKGCTTIYGPNTWAQNCIILLLLIDEVLQIKFKIQM